MALVFFYLVLVLLFSLVSSRLKEAPITAPMLFTLGGVLAVVGIPEAANTKMNFDILLGVAEAGLVLLLFTDAGRTNFELLRNTRSLPTRLLSVGLLLTIALGLLFAKVLFPGMTFWEAGILAAILAPTDAGLGQVIVNDTRVPAAVRQSLSVEAGLNDGLAVPFLLFFMALAGLGATGSEASLVRFILQQLLLGAVIGAVIGGAGGWLLGHAARAKWSEASWEPLGAVTLPFLCALVCEHFGASMFIAAFIAGAAAQFGFKEVGQHSVEFAEGWGQLLNLSVFLLFGLSVGRSWREFEISYLIYGILSLTVVRAVPVAIALWGTNLSRASVCFIGWFGPRGLASIVLALVYVRELPEPQESAIRSAAMVTVLLSIILHGVSAVPGIKRYARVAANLGASSPEFRSIGNGGR